MKKFVKKNTIITIERGGLVRTYMLTGVYPPKWIKTECWEYSYIKKLIKQLIKEGYHYVD